MASSISNEGQSASSDRSRMARLIDDGEDSQSVEADIAWIARFIDRFRVLRGGIGGRVVTQSVWLLP